MVHIAKSNTVANHINKKQQKISSPTPLVATPYVVIPIYRLAVRSEGFVQLLFDQVNILQVVFL